MYKVANELVKAVANEKLKCVCVCVCVCVYTHTYIVCYTICTRWRMNW